MGNKSDLNLQGQYQCYSMTVQTNGSIELLYYHAGNVMILKNKVQFKIFTVWGSSSTFRTC